MDSKALETKGWEPEAADTTYRWGKSIVVIFAYTIYAMEMSLVSLTIPDLCDKMDITIEEMGIALSAGSLSWIFGTVLMGMVIDRFSRHYDLIMAVCFVVLGAFCIMKPFMPSLGLFITIMFLEGFVFGTIDPLCNVQVLYMWGDKADPITQTLHLCWGIGSSTLPLLVAPFLVDRPDETEWNNTTTVVPLSVTTDHFVSTDDLNFEIPFLIVGPMCIIVGFMALGIYLCGPSNQMAKFLKPKESLRDMLSSDACSCYTIQMLILCTIMFFAIVGREYTFNTWIFTYALEGDLDFNKQEAALLSSANKASFTAGMVISTIASKFISPPPILFTVSGLGLALTIALAIWGTQYKTALWVLSCVLNICQGPLWPTGILYTDKFIEVSALVLGVLLAGGGVASVIFHYLTGYLFTNAESADSFMYILIGCAILLCIILTITQCVGMQQGYRYDDKKKEEEKQQVPPVTEVTSTYL